MKTAVRLGPIAHLRRAKCIGNISNNQAWEWGGDMLPFTLIPGYHISPRMGWGWRVKFPDKTIKSHAEHFYGFWTRLPKALPWNSLGLQPALTKSETWINYTSLILSNLMQPPLKTRKNLFEMKHYRHKIFMLLFFYLNLQHEVV